MIHCAIVNLTHAMRKSPYVLQLVLGEVAAQKAAEPLELRGRVSLQVLVKDKVQVGGLALLPGLLHVSPVRPVHHWREPSLWSFFLSRLFFPLFTNLIDSRGNKGNKNAKPNVTNFRLQQYFENKTC